VEWPYERMFRIAKETQGYTLNNDLVTEYWDTADHGYVLYFYCSQKLLGFLMFRF